MFSPNLIPLHGPSRNAVLALNTLYPKEIPSDLLHDAQEQEWLLQTIDKTATTACLDQKAYQCAKANLQTACKSLDTLKNKNQDPNFIQNVRIVKTEAARVLERLAILYDDRSYIPTFYNSDIQAQMITKMIAEEATSFRSIPSFKLVFNTHID